MIPRHYLYLDSQRLEDYLSSLDPGVIEEFTETVRSQSGKEGKAGLRAHFVELGGGANSEDETTREQSVRVTDRHAFNRIYQEFNKASAVTIFEEDEPIPFKNLARRQVVEITRNFSPSSLNDMIDSILRLADVVRQFGYAEEVDDPETQQAIQAIAMLFQGETGKEEVPMFARSEENRDEKSSDDCSVLFLAKSRYILVDREEFKDEMTIFGTVHKKVPDNESIDLLDFLKLPRQLKRKESTFKKELLEMFESFPEEFGGPIKPESTKLTGPAVIVTPLAAYGA